MDEMNFYINWMTRKNRQLDAQNKAEQARIIRAIKAAQPGTTSPVRSILKRVSTWIHTQPTNATLDAGCGCGCCATT